MEVEAGLPGGNADASAHIKLEDLTNRAADTAGESTDVIGKLPLPAEQASEIEAAEAKDLTEGEEVYLISEG